MTAFIGATIFEAGSVLLMFEAVNESREGCFGWALKRVSSRSGSEEDQIRVQVNEGICSHHHTKKSNLAGKGAIKAAGVVSAQDVSGFSFEKAGGAVIEISTGRGWSFKCRYY